jgi:hypothetical protein
MGTHSKQQSSRSKHRTYDEGKHNMSSLFNYLHFEDGEDRVKRHRDTSDESETKRLKSSTSGLRRSTSEMGEEDESRRQLFSKSDRGAKVCSSFLCYVAY